jgi:hypothetical protein
MPSPSYSKVELVFLNPRGGGRLMMPWSSGPLNLGDPNSDRIGNINPVFVARLRWTLWHPEA